MALKATSLEVLRIIVSIGGVETNHFSLWHDKAGNAVAQPLAGVTDPETGVTLRPMLDHDGGAVAGRALGHGLREFRSSVAEGSDDGLPRRASRR